MHERLLFVAAGLAQLPAIREARRAGHFVVAMDGAPNAPGLLEANDYRVANITDAQAIMRVFRETGAHAIVSICCDAAMEAVAEANTHLGLPGISAEVARVSRSKLLQREAIYSAGLLTPKFALVSSVDAALHAWDEFQVEACVIKPVDSSGSRGVSFVPSREGVLSAFTQARQASRSEQVMVESFMPGTEYSVEAWVVGAEVRVLAMSEKVRTTPPYLLDREVHFPDNLPPRRRELMIEHAVRAIEACGFHDCPVHLECIDHSDGPVVVELAARGAGFKVFSEILPKLTGVSTASASIEIALGREPDLLGKGTMAAASLVFLDPVPGKLTRVIGVEDARKLPGMAEVTIYPTYGQQMGQLRSGSDRAGHILVFASNSSECRATAREARSLIKLEVVN